MCETELLLPNANFGGVGGLLGGVLVLPIDELGLFGGLLPWESLLGGILVLLTAELGLLDWGLLPGEDLLGELDCTGFLDLDDCVDG